MAVESVKNVQMTSFQPAQTASQPSAPEAVNEAKETEKVTESVALNTPAPESQEDESKQILEKDPSDSTIKQAIKEINKKMNCTVAEFGYHEGTHRVTIKIKDKDTDKVVKEIPAEKTLDMIEKAWELAGILVDEKR